LVFYLDPCSRITLGGGEFVYYEPDCSLIPLIGDGCNAGGIKNCRYCGFDQFTNITCPTSKISSLFEDFIYIFDFDSNYDDIVLNLYLNETEKYLGELKIDYSYEDDDGYKVTDVSSISNN
jgi:hypothetical protein